MPATMKAARVHEIGRELVVEDIPIPAPSRGQVLVKVAACGVCHSDLHLLDGDWGTELKLPYIPGHEVAGTVAAVGADVAHLREGERVGVPWLHSSCGVCEYCLTGWETLCPTQANSGYTVDGGFAEYMLADANYIAKLPDQVGFVEAAPILCAGVATYKGIKESEVRPGQWVAVSGIGGLGHIAVQYARAMGLHVAAVDIDDGRLALARELGAEIAVNATKEDAARAVRKATGGGAHAVLVTASAAAAFQQAINMLRRGGVCVPIGLPTGNLEVPILNLVIKRLTIRGSIVGSRSDLHEALQFAAEGKVHSKIERQPIENVNAVLDRMRRGQIDGRIVFEI